jgi:hypothetical protein
VPFERLSGTDLEYVRGMAKAGGVELSVAQADSARQ